MLQKYIFLLVIVWLSGCKTEDFGFPDEPVITFKSMEQYKLNGRDSAVVIEIDYTDGDGDIGLEPSDSLAPFQFGGPYFYNLQITVWEVDNGISKPLLIPSSTDTINFNDRIKTLTPSGKNKAIYGTIKLNLNAKPYFSLSPDSMFYKIRITDRKLHRSNEISTPVKPFVF